jgi:2'-5' RNA ligase
MAFAISLLFDTRMAGAVEQQWAQLAKANISRSMIDLDFPPHVTLAAYDSLAIPAAISALDNVLIRINQMRVELTRLSTFEAGSGVLYAALAPSTDLINLHAAVETAVGKTCRPHYRAGSWIPHCTLATGVSDAGLTRATKLLGQRGVPLGGYGDIGRVRSRRPDQALGAFQPHDMSRSSMCRGAGAVTRTGSLFFEIGITSSRECRCSRGSPKRGTYCSLRRRRKLACVP